MHNVRCCIMQTEGLDCTVEQVTGCAGGRSLPRAASAQEHSGCCQQHGCCTQGVLHRKSGCGLLSRHRHAYELPWDHGVLTPETFCLDQPSIWTATASSYVKVTIPE